MWSSLSANWSWSSWCSSKRSQQRVWEVGPAQKPSCLNCAEGWFDIWAVPACQSSLAVEPIPLLKQMTQKVLNQLVIRGTSVSWCGPDKSRACHLQSVFLVWVCISFDMESEPISVWFQETVAWNGILSRGIFGMGCQLWSRIVPLQSVQPDRLGTQTDLELHENSWKFLTKGFLRTQLLMCTSKDIKIQLKSSLNTT